jgi:predicted lysophospholipase L1 biosynthesis ABC-type transport system permease subunit
VVAHLDFDRSGYDELRSGAFVRELIARLVRQPGVGSVVMPGAANGLLAAGSSERLLESRIYGITSWDPVSVGAAALSLALAALGAAYFPTRRATRIDPVRLLRVAGEL